MVVGATVVVVEATVVVVGATVVVVVGATVVVVVGATVVVGGTTGMNPKSRVWSFQPGANAVTCISGADAPNAKASASTASLSWSSGVGADPSS